MYAWLYLSWEAAARARTYRGVSTLLCLAPVFSVALRAARCNPQGNQRDTAKALLSQLLAQNIAKGGRCNGIPKSQPEYTHCYLPLVPQIPSASFDLLFPYLGRSPTCRSSDRLSGTMRARLSGQEPKSPSPGTMNLTWQLLYQRKALIILILSLAALFRTQALRLIQMGIQRASKDTNARRLNVA